jgi:hypothetical protein
METGPSALPELGRGDIGPITKRFVRRIDQLQLRFLLLFNIVSLNIIVACANAKGNPSSSKNLRHPGAVNLHLAQSRAARNKFTPDTPFGSSGGSFNLKF